MSKKNILMISPFFSPNLGGVETHLDDLTSYLAKEEFNITVITYQPLTAQYISAPFHEQKKNLNIYRLPWLKFNLFYRLESKPLLQFLYLFPGIFLFSLFFLLTKSGRTDSIHGHGLAAAVAALFLSKLFRKKGIVSLHTIYKFAERPLLASIVKKLLSPLDHILVLAKGCKDDLTAIGIPEQKILVYSCWVENTLSFIPRDQIHARTILGLPRDKFLVLFVGRLSPEKGVAAVLNTVRMIHSAEITFVLVGDGPMRSDVDGTAASHNNLITISNVANSELMHYYNACDILLFGSVDEDYYGRVTMEALSCGLPVILPDRTSYFGKEKKVNVNFPQGEIGYMVPPAAENTAPLLEQLNTDSTALSAMKESARLYALANFGEKNAQLFADTYRT